MTTKFNINNISLFFMLNLEKCEVSPFFRKRKLNFIFNFLSNKYEHLYCQQCLLEWYKENSLTCLLCMCPIDPDNISLEYSAK